MQCRDKLVYCGTIGTLARAWSEISTTLKTLEQGQIMALIAMKDFYKRMIEKGQIDEYIQARRAAAAKEWTIEQIQQSPHPDRTRLVRQQGRAAKVARSPRSRKTR